MNNPSKQEIIIAINGYLESIAIINSFADDQKTYYAESMRKIDDNIQKTLKHFFKVKEWEITLIKPHFEWQVTLKKELRPYFDQIIVQVCTDPTICKAYSIEAKEPGETKELAEKIKNSNNYNIDELLNVFLKKIESFIAGAYFEFHKIDICRSNSNEVFYECYYNDYLFDLGDDILFIHFGGSD